MQFFWSASPRLLLIPLLLLTATVLPDKSMAAPQLVLSWTNLSTLADGIKIERKTGTSGTFAQIATVAANVTWYTDASISSSTTYCYRLRAYNTAGASAYSNEACGAALNQTATLTVSKTGNGSGAVSSAPTGITCSATCSASYTTGTAVTLTATPAAGATFSGWNGGGCSGTGNCVVTLTADTSVTATFSATPQPSTLTVTKAGSGSGGVVSTPAGLTCGTTCSASYTTGTTLTLTAGSAPGSTFSGWSGGGCSGTGNCVVTLTADTSVTATFAATPQPSIPATPQTSTLTVTKVGSGNISSTPAGLICGTTCSASYTTGMTLTLTATPATGSTFSGWSGGGCSGVGSCAVTLSANTSVTATFTSQTNVRIGVFRPSTGKWYLDVNSNGLLDDCAVGGCLEAFGQPDNYPLVGDWTGTGTAKIGIFDPSTRIWELDRSGNDRWDGCTADVCLGFSWRHRNLPVVGHWTKGSTADTIGVYLPLRGVWRFDFNGNGKWDDCTVDGCEGPFGKSTDLPVVGDWTGTGATQIGIFDPSTGMWKLDRNGNGKLDDCTVDGCMGPFGIPSDLPVVGDWDGTGKSKIGVFDSSTGMWELDLNGNGRFDGCKVDSCLGPFGQQGDLPVVGKW